MILTLISTFLGITASKKRGYLRHVSFFFSAWIREFLSPSWMTHLPFNPPSPPCQGGVVVSVRFSPPLIRGGREGFAFHAITVVERGKQ